MSTKKEVIAAGKKHGLFITENSGADYAAKNLFKCNKRLEQLEDVMRLGTENTVQNAAWNTYCKKWGVK